MVLMVNFEIEESTVAQLRNGLDSGKFTSVGLTQSYLDRIERLDPLLGSVIETNPDAIKIAETCDRERQSKSTKAGPLHGIPILIKDNIDTADKMNTTAGSMALLDAPKPKQDAFIIKKLRDAGAIILGKTNMSEWAYARSSEGISGWSARGGFTNNPYDLARNPLGSSSGSAAAVSANLSSIAVGTETDGSILTPAAACSVVGIKPSVGLISRSGIIPISFTQDTAGPITRSVADAACLLTILSGIDPEDEATTTNPLSGTDFSEFLNPEKLGESRIGVVQDLVTPHHSKVINLFNSAVETIKTANSEVVQITDILDTQKLADAEKILLMHEYKHTLNLYLKNRESKTITNIEDLIGFNNNSEVELKYFGQNFLLETANQGELLNKEYTDALDRCKKLSQSEGIDMLIEKYDLDCLIAPTVNIPHLTDAARGDNDYTSSTSLAAVAGYPSITVPVGYVSGLPVGISFIGKKWSEPELIAIAYSFEEITKARKAPELDKS